MIERFNQLWREMPKGSIRWGALFMLALLLLVGLQLITFQPSRQFGSVQQAYANTPTATSTPTVTPTPSPAVGPSPAPTPTVVVGSPCSNVSTSGATVGVSWCQDQTTTPYVLMVYNGTAWVPIASIPKGIHPASSWPNNGLWINVGDYPPTLQICNASGCTSNNCTSLCGVYDVLTIPSFP
jgi:hypothetical protein